MHINDRNDMTKGDYMPNWAFIHHNLAYGMPCILPVECNSIWAVSMWMLTIVVCGGLCGTGRVAVVLPSMSNYTD